MGAILCQFCVTFVAVNVKKSYQKLKSTYLSVASVCIQNWFKGLKNSEIWLFLVIPEAGLEPARYM